MTRIIGFIQDVLAQTPVYRSIHNPVEELRKAKKTRRSRCNLKFRRRKEDSVSVFVQPETICIENIQTTMERKGGRERGRRGMATAEEMGCRDSRTGTAAVA